MLRQCCDNDFGMCLQLRRSLFVFFHSVLPIARKLARSLPVRLTSRALLLGQEAVTPTRTSASNMPETRQSSSLLSPQTCRCLAPSARTQGALRVESRDQTLARMFGKLFPSMTRAFRSPLTQTQVHTYMLACRLHGFDDASFDLRLRGARVRISGPHRKMCSTRAQEHTRTS